MLPEGMTVSEATDLVSLAKFTREQLIAWGYPAKPIADLAKVEGGRQRYFVMEKDGIIATAYFLPFKTHTGPSSEVKLFLVKHDAENRLLISDYFVLWVSNLMLSEGIQVLTSRSDLTGPSPIYGRDQVGSTVEVSGNWITETLYPADIIKHIFNRRPSWRTSLSSMT